MHIYAGVRVPDPLVSSPSQVIFRLVAKEIREELRELAKVEMNLLEVLQTKEGVLNMWKKIDINRNGDASQFEVGNHTTAHHKCRGKA